MSLVNRLFGFSTKDVYLVEMLIFHEKKIVDPGTAKFYFRPAKAFRVVREKQSGNGTYYKDLIGHKKYRDLQDFDNNFGDIVVTKTMPLDKKRRLRYKDAKVFNDSINEQNYHELDNVLVLK